MHFAEFNGGVVVKISRYVVSLALLATPCIASGQDTVIVRRGTPEVRPGTADAMKRVVEVRAKVARAGMPHHMMMDAASMFLGMTGDLQLTDAQVTKLAAIARRAESREKAMKARMDTMMTMRRPEPAEGGARMGGPGMM